MHDPILITGAPRSGTSMVAGATNLCGAFGGEMRGPNRNNPKGMFENARIVNSIVKPYLRKLNVDPMGQFPLPDIKTLPIPSNLKTLVEGIMQQEGYSKGPWFYKGAKMCLVWPIWHYAFPDAKWVIVRRSTPDIIHSCFHTSFMRAFSRPPFQQAVGAKNESEGWLWWVHQHEERFAEMIQAGLNVKVVWPDRMVNGNYKQLYQTIDWLGLKWNSKAVVEFVDPKLWHTRERRSA